MTQSNPMSKLRLRDGTLFQHLAMLPVSSAC